VPRPCQQETGITKPLWSRQHKPQPHHDPGQGVKDKAEAGEEQAFLRQGNGIAYQQSRPAQGLIDCQEHYAYVKSEAELAGFRLACRIRHGCVATPESFFSER